MRSILALAHPVALTVRVGEEHHTVSARSLERIRVYVIEDAPSNPALVGQLTMPRWPRTLERQVVRQRKRLPFRSEDVAYVVYEDLYALHRALSHVVDRYEVSEVPRLTTAIEHCHALHGVVLGLRTENFQELIGRIEGLVDQVVAAIGIDAKNAEKLTALEHVIVTRKGVDSLNRVNSSVACLRMLTAVGELIRREAGVTDIVEVYALRRQNVRLQLATLETLVHIVEDFLNQILAHWNTVRVRRRELTTAQLEHFVRSLTPVTVKPFSTTFQHVVREFSEAARCIRAGHLDQAKALLAISAASMRLRRLRVQLEAVHYRVSSATYDAAMRKRAGIIAQDANLELGLLVQELRAVDTVGMVDFSRTGLLATLADAQAALVEGNVAVAADNFRLALRTL